MWLSTRFRESSSVSGLLFLFIVAGCSGSTTDPVEQERSDDETPPAAVSDLRVINPTPTTLTLRWTAPGDDGQQGFAVAYDLRRSSDLIAPESFSQALPIALEGAPLPAGTTEEVVLADLAEGETYFFALKARDDEGLVSDMSNCAQGSCLEERVVAVPDAALSQLLRQTLVLPPGDIMLSDMLRLQELDGNELGIADLTGMETAANLRMANLLGNEIADPSPLGQCLGLEALNLTMNQLTDLTGLEDLTGLVQLGIGQNQVSDISVLAAMLDLEILSIHANPLLDLTPLDGLQDLREINLSSLGLVELSVLGGKNSLRVVWATANQIVDISALATLQGLEAVHLGYNEIEDLTPLVDNVYFAQDCYLDVRENPLTETARNVQIAALRSRGVTVEY